MSYCFASGCNHRRLHDTCQFFRFPKEAKTFNVWKKMCRRKDSEPNRDRRLCSCHFKNGNKLNGPTIFPWNKGKYFDFPSPEQRKKKKREKPPKSHADQEDVEPEAIVGEPWENDETIATAELPSMEYALKALAAYEVENSQLKRELVEVRSELQLKIASSKTPGNVMSFASLKGNRILFHYYTGLPNYDAFEALLEIISLEPLKYLDGWKPSLPLEDQLLLALVKLRMNPDYTDLGARFQISRQAVRNVFLTVASSLHAKLFPIVKMPSRSKKSEEMPPAFKNFSNCRCIVDCTEITWVIPRNSMEKQSQKHRTTFKALIACSPHGAVTFISQLFPDSVSDEAIFRESGIISLLEPGDLILADKGFLIGDLLPPGVTVNVPTFLTSQQQQSEAKITTEIARARTEIKKVIRKLKTYSILDSVPVCLREHGDLIFQLVGCLIYLHQPLSQPLEDCVLD